MRGSRDPDAWESAGSRRIQRSRGHRSLEVVQDPDGSDNPEATDPWKGCRIQMDPTIQRPQIAVEGAGLEPRSTRLFSLGKVRRLGNNQETRTCIEARSAIMSSSLNGQGLECARQILGVSKLRMCLFFETTAALKHAKTRIASTKNTQAKVKVHPVPG